MSSKEARPSWVCAMVFNATSIGACCIVLAFAGAIYHNPDTRTALRRQSLVMLLVALVMSIFFNLGNMMSYVYNEGSKLCAITVVVMLFAGNFQHFILMLIAINLQLTVVHGISTVGFTPWYIGGSCLLSLITVIPGAAVHIWGYDPFVEACWMVISDQKQRVYWSVGTTHLWTLLSAGIALFSTFAVLVKLKATTNKVRNTFTTTGARALTRQNLLVSVTLRILPHPVYFVISNIISVVIDLHVSLHYQSGFKDGPIILLYSFFYATPALFFSCVILFFDPSFSTAVQRLCRSAPAILGSSCTRPRTSDETPVALSDMSGRPSNPTTARATARNEIDLEIGHQQSTGKVPLPDLDSHVEASPPDSKPRLDLTPTLHINLTGSESRVHVQTNVKPNKRKDVDFDAL